MVASRRRVGRWAPKTRSKGQHTMWIKKLLIAGAALAGLMLGTSEAKADYVCSVRYFPGSTSLGSEGYTYLFTTSAPDCAGTVDITYFCTTGASSTACPASATYRYERHGILALFQALQRASTADQYVIPVVVACNGTGGTTCGAYVSFTSE